ENVEMLSGYVSTYKLTDSERDIAAEIWNACRAAMLPGKGEGYGHFNKKRTGMVERITGRS
ncbi:hypothetical protein OFM39_26260, partial [Escherichia coli]|nr:hypothetical protein [Escherichia coli]